MTPPRIAVVGVHGYGASHVLTALALQDAGRAELVALVDPRQAPIEREGTTLALADLPPFVPSLPELLARTPVDVVIIATPLHTHALLARQALEVGADVLLEKPPVTSRAELADLLACQEATGGLVQVGFQGLDSRALAALASAMRSGALGAVTGMGAIGSWSRDRAYYDRAPWAGRRHLGQTPAGGPVDVMDGALTNPFAHAVMALLVLAGRTRAQDVGSIEVDLYHAHDIEADDTAALRLGAADDADPVYAGPLMVAVTLAGPREALPVIEVTGSRATARLYYTQDRLEVGPSAGQYERDDLLDDLLAVREAGAGPASLLAPLQAMGSFVEVVEAVRNTEPVRVDPQLVTWHGTGRQARPVIDGIDDALAACVRDQLLLRETGLLGTLPWTR